MRDSFLINKKHSYKSVCVFLTGALGENRTRISALPLLCHTIELRGQQSYYIQFEIKIQQKYDIIF